MKAVSKEDTELILVSLIIAVALWFNVTMGRQTSIAIAEKQFLGVKVQIVGLPVQFDCEVKPDKLDVLLRGLPNDLSKVNTEDVKMTIDLTGLSEGKWFVTPQGNVAEKRTYVVKVIPDRIEVILKPHIDKPKVQ